MLFSLTSYSEISQNSMACGLYQARRFASTIESIAKSLKDRSYLRPHKPYTPPEDAEKKLDGIFESQLGSNSAQLSNGRIKFKVLTACFKEFNHGVPNSKLHEILTTDDIRDFYLQEIDTRVPLDKFKSIELPPNVSIQYDYHRFHPDTDTMHGGISAFPRRSTIVTGLKYKKKYAGYNYKPIWH
ncbi:39S ribosomal protein L50, mitochondrial-like [Daphnia pulex]|uniref:39S ribosomal protein L50, mitochondrial-like n=1 Tax=Daphnia pulex TaxID=6669 RepID=UPI001EE089D7|nr:39S ribosomal protein L50, mitochondrial-like [Daphnia pulex]